MSSPLKKEKTLITHQLITHPGIIVGTEINVNRDVIARVLIQHASTEATANATGVQYLVQISSKASGNEDWITIKTFTTGTTLPKLANIAGAEAAGEKTIAVGSAQQVGFAPGSPIYIRDTTVETDSEWGFVDSIPTDIIDIVDGLARAKDGSDDIINEAELFDLEVDLSGATRLRVLVIDRPATGSDTACKAVLYGDLD